MFSPASIQYEGVLLSDFSLFEPFDEETTPGNPETFFLLQENGDALLQENGDKILLEAAP